MTQSVGFRPSRRALTVPVDEERTALYSTITHSSAMLPCAPSGVQGALSRLSPGTLAELERYLLVEPEGGSDASSFQEYEARRDVYRYRSGGLEFVVHLTFDCNLRCPYCYENGIDRSRRLTDEGSVALMDYIEQTISAELPKQVSVTFIGGEPSLSTDLLELIARRTLELHDNVRFFVVSNGTLLSDEFLDTCEQLGILRFQITVDGDRALHDSLRSRPDGSGTFDQILSNIERMERRPGPFEIVVNCNLSDRNRDVAASLISELERIQFHGDLIFSWVFGGAYTGFESTLGKHETTWLSTHLVAEQHGYQHDPFYRVGYLACGMYSRATRLLGADGFVYSCFSGIGRPDYQVGPMRRSDSPLFDCMWAAWLERPCFSPGCTTCEFVPVCNGNCTYLNDVSGYDCPRLSLRRNELELLRCHLRS